VLIQGELQITKFIPYVVIPAIIVTLIFLMAKKADKPIDEMNGMIEAVTAGPATPEHPVPDRTAIIRLADGTILQAHIATPSAVHSGQKAKILVYERGLSAVRSYEVVDAENVR